MIEDKIKFKGKLVDIEEFLGNIFENLPDPKIRLSIDELKTFANGDILGEKDLENLEKITNANDLENFIMNPKTQNVGVREMLATFLADRKIPFNEKLLRTCNKDHICIIFANIFDIIEVGTPAPEPEPAPEPNPTPGTESVTTQIVPAKNLELDLYTMQTILDDCNFKIRDDVDATSFELTDKMPVTLLNDFYMIIPQNLQIYYGATAIITQNKPYEVAAVGSLKLHAGQTHILLESKNISYDLFSKQNRFYIVLFPQHAQKIFDNGEYYGGEVYLVECQVDLKQLDKARTTLCIDFGTSNTTIGSYGIKNPEVNEPEIVEFLDETGDIPQKRKMLPTVVYIESFNGNKIKYLFGYEALKRVIDKDYNPTASVFYEIKRWINSIDAEETVTDEQGRKTQVTHREIIQAYLDHVLNLAEQYFERKFTKLHFTAPVKLKDSFIEEMTAMFGNNGREVIKAGIAIDEGIAIIYNHIAEQMKKQIFAERADKKSKSGDAKKSSKVFIIDCGGGTTDLASCEYSLNLEGYNKNLNIITRFENGDSNFGGNNITFRILQLLKIKLAKKLQGNDDFSLQNLIDDENKLLYNIDDNHDKIFSQVNAETKIDDSNQEKFPPKDDREIAYSKFDAEYDKAEIFVPTKFGKENLIKKKSQLKRNFYYLWQIAEAYKIQFYRANMDFVSVNFSNPEDRKIGIPDDNKYYLFIRKTADGELEKVTNPMSGIEITNNDIHRLLYADIYSLLKNVLEEYDTGNNEQELLRYNYYKLSGQSCKITLFNELLKEFIPGKYLRYDDRKKISPDSSELKLACINGSIYYMRDSEHGEIKPNITMETPNLIYNVCKVNVDNVIERFMLKRGAEKIEPQVEVLSSNTRLVRFIVFSQNSKKQNTIDFEIDKTREIATKSDDVAKIISQNANDSDGAIGKYVINQLISIKLDKTRLESVFAVFAVPSKTGYGFYLYCLTVKSQGTPFSWTQPPKYFSFEDTALETFFDGGR